MRGFPDPADYWTETDGRRAVEAWRRSGESGAAFARRHGVSAKRLRWWSKRLAAPTSSPLVSLVPATVVATDEVAAVIRAPGGVAIELTNATASQIAAIAIALARPTP